MIITFPSGNQYLMFGPNDYGDYVLKGLAGEEVGVLPREAEVVEDSRE